MRLLLYTFLVLCVCSFTFSVPALERDASETREVSSGPSTSSDVQDQDDTQEPAAVVHEKPEAEESEANIKVERTERRRKFDKRVKNRYNKLSSNKDKRKKWRRRRPSNGKKGASKSKPKAIIEIVPYNFDIAKANQAVDNLLVLASQYIKDGPGLNVKLATPPTNIKAKPWGYIVLESAGSINNTSEERVRSKRESDDNESDGDDAEFDVEDDAEADEDNNDDKEDATTPIPEDGISSNSTQESVADQTAELEPTPLSKDESVAENDDDDEEDDEEAGDIKGEMINSTSLESKQHATPKLSPVPHPIKQEDGSLIYHLQLLDDDDAIGTPETVEEPNSFKSRALDDIRIARKEDKISRPRNQRRFRRTRAVVNGLEAIKRSEDISAGILNGTNISVYEIRLDVGPVYLTFNESTVFSVPVTRISTGMLKARLKLKERDGKLMSVRTKPLKMRPNNVVVSVKAAEEQPTFDDETARSITHLSQEVARAWNSGYLLRHVKRNLKKLLLSGPKVDERTSASQNIREQSEAILQKIFDSVKSATPSTTASPELTGASNVASTTPVPSVA